MLGRGGHASVRIKKKDRTKRAAFAFIAFYLHLAATVLNAVLDDRGVDPITVDIGAST